MSASTIPCALLPSREQAEAARRRLLESDIEAWIVAPGDRYHRLDPGRWELRVEAGLAARARAILNEPVP